MHVSGIYRETLGARDIGTYSETKKKYDNGNANFRRFCNLAIKNLRDHLIGKIDYVYEEDQLNYILKNAPFEVGHRVNKDGIIEIWRKS